MANIIIPQVTIIDPSGAFPNSYAPGETLILQRSPSGLVTGVYNYSGGVTPITERTLTAPASSTAESRAILLLQTVRGLVWV